MKHIKMISAVIAAALLTGCAVKTDEAPSATTAAIALPMIIRIIKTWRKIPMRDI